MLSYKHGYHAGNQADVLKHICLIQAYKSLKKHHNSISYIDTHAGSGDYNFKSDYMSKNKEYEKSVMEKGFFNHSFMPMGPDGPMYFVWEVKDGISASEFQDFIDGPDGVNFGLVALNNNVMQLNLELTGGQTPYERKF